VEEPLSASTASWAVSTASLGPRAEACREPINVHRGNPDPHIRIIANFAPTPFTFRGKQYASLEGFWQMMKYPEGADDPRAKFPDLKWSYTREQVAQLTGFEAKKAGTLAGKNMEKMGIDWVTFEGRKLEYEPKVPGEHYKLIVEATWEKVRQNAEVKKILLATGDLVLKPDHHQEPDAPAAWRYYEILTTIRTELQKKN
jgi:predicted NAD-dependent protein-ADP-ribosyltransferase YbiA (DUF1768 family)